MTDTTDIMGCATQQVQGRWRNYSLRVKPFYFPKWPHRLRIKINPPTAESQKGELESAAGKGDGLAGKVSGPAEQQGDETEHEGSRRQTANGATLARVGTVAGTIRIVTATGGGAFVA